MHGMSAIDVVVDASVVLKWFREHGEEEVAPARVLLDRHRQRVVRLAVLDLTTYEVGNALMRGRVPANADQIALVLDTLAEICPVIVPGQHDLAHAAVLADEHSLTFYDAAYAAVARSRGARLATHDAALLRGGLGRTPADLLPAIDAKDT